MRARQNQGPWFLAGHCLGGVVAFEMAQQLRAAGEDVALVALLDTIVGESRQVRVHPPIPVRFERSWQQLAAHSGWDRLAYLARRARDLGARHAEQHRRWRALGSIESMLQSYNLRPYPGRLTLLLAADSFLRRDQADPRLSWARYATGGCEVYSVEGDHETLLRTPFVRSTAERLRDALGWDADSGIGRADAPLGSLQHVPSRRDQP
jgi:thioesterase domain-containing protein